MGAMATPPHWTPQDDLLLKNAVEAGASLESLAKGAVQFSDRFSVQEIQNRWYCLLYDPVVSEEVSTRMVDSERCASMYPARPNRFENVKETTCSSRKRTAESIRKCYYSKRKRIVHEPFNMMGINLLSRPGISNFGDDNDLSPADCRSSKNFGVKSPAFETANGSSSHFRHHATDTIAEKMSRPYEENIPLTGDDDIPRFDQSKEMPMCDMFDAEGLENEENTCPDFGGPSFHGFGCSSPLPQMPIWSASPDIAAASLPIESREDGQQTGDVFVIPHAGDANDAEELGYVGTDIENTNLETAPLSDGGIIRTTEHYLEELSNKLLDFENESEFLFMDTEGAPIDKSYFDGLSLLLLDSPNRSKLPRIDEDAVVADVHFVNGNGANTEGPDNAGLHLCYPQKIPDAQVVPSVSMVKNVGPECRNVDTCILNCIDLEVPSNDDVFLPVRFPSSSNFTWDYFTLKYSGSMEAMDFSSSPRVNGGLSLVENNQKGSRTVGPSQPPGMGSKLPNGDRGVKFELPKSNIQHPAPRNARKECENHINTANVAVNNSIASSIKGCSMKTEPEKKSDKHYTGNGICKDTRSHANGMVKKLDGNVDIPKDGLPNISFTSQNADIHKPTTNTEVPDQEQLWSEDDLDIPYFSDVEAMILEMDLCSDEFDLHANPEVLRYQHEQTKRTIIRLEQGANACMQRAIAAQGAFGVFYSHCSKYYMRKSEVLLGRATEDNQVDIDLGKEKNGGKVSRRQAIVKMDMYGVFKLTNLGKSPIHVNGVEVVYGQKIVLSSGCLIQVRGLSFLFEMNREVFKRCNGATGCLPLECKPEQRS